MKPYRRSSATAAVLVAVLVAAQLPAGAAPPTAGLPALVPAAGAVPTGPARTVTLLTGDRVTVYGDDAARWTVTRGAGREKIKFSATRAAGHLRVVPSDAVAPLRGGLLDSRLFDVTTLLDDGYDDRSAELPLIVAYADGAVGQAARTRTATAGARVVRALPGRGNFAVRAERRDPGRFWRDLTGAATGGTPSRPSGDAPELAGAAGVRKVWLDGMRKPALADSVARIGAPTAWQAGYTGAGVTVAILDSGVDANHPDLTGRVTAAQNFTEGFEDDRDLVGHGTHVASIVAGTGAASGGRERGVAPDAHLVSGKVCIVSGCAESWILAGMQWAAAEQHAKIVNLSLGGPDFADTDPLEQAVADLSAQYGTLFVVAAGNDGPVRSVGSPASAPAALAVGAVDGDDHLADFSSRGPALGDDAVKPDVTAPGVDILAARGADAGIGTPGAAYVTLSGTSMATPHVAGAAALLAQQHPDWTGQQLKAALMASAVRVSGTEVFGQGAGRVDLPRALAQSITSTPPSVALGLQPWPHDDDRPVTATVTYHNSGAQPVHLSLAVQATGPTGQPAPAGMFTLGADELDVPAGGSAQTTVTANTNSTAPDGDYGGYLVATAGTTVLNTPFSVGKETEHFNLTLVHTGRDGAPATDVQPMVIRVDGTSEEIPVPADGRLRLPRGTYMIGTWIYGADGDVTHLVQPRLELTQDQTVSLDARLGKPLQVTVPDPTAGSIIAELVAGMPTDDGTDIATVTFGDTFDQTYSAQLGPDGTQDGVWAKVGSQWARGGVDGKTDSPYGYRLAWYTRGRIPTGFTHDVRPAELATVHVTYGSTMPGQYGGLSVIAAAQDLPEGGFYGEIDFALPATRTEYYLAGPGLSWENGFFEQGGDGGSVTSTWGVSSYAAGRTYRETWNQGVRGPAFFGLDNPDGKPKGVSRTGDEIRSFLSLYSDDPNRFALSEAADYTSSLYRNGQLVGAATGWESAFTVPAGDAAYRLRLEAGRDGSAALATRTTIEWTFRSASSPGKTTPLPVSLVRFAPPLDENNALPAGKTVTFPVTTYRQPGAAPGSLRTPTVEVSYDDGATWRLGQLVQTSKGLALTLRHPADAEYVSLRARATDTAGNTLDQTIMRAYRLKR